MIIQPKIRGFICMNAHPQGCKTNIDKQIEFVTSQRSLDGPKNVLVIGSSTGYGLASRIMSAFGSGANTVGVFFERPGTNKRTASSGWYNTAAFEDRAIAAGLGTWSINGDAFSNEIKEQTIEIIKQKLGKIDLIVYSVAAPKRTDPDTGITYSSTLKPIAHPYSNLTIDPATESLKEITIEPATDEEIAGTVAVMGGSDWQKWLDCLQKADVLSPECINIAYTYVGPNFTHAIYRSGTIGKAKEHLEETANLLNKKFPFKSIISVNKALVTQASAAIPVIPLYIMLLFKLMKEKRTHETTIQQIHRLFSKRLYSPGEIPTDMEGRIRIDDYEMDPAIQETVKERFINITEKKVKEFCDIDGYQKDFLNLFGFGIEEIDYDKDIDQIVRIPSII